MAADIAKGNDKFKILGGSLGTQNLDVEGVKALASLPSLDELRGKLLGMIQTPATRIAGIFKLRAPSWPVSSRLRRKGRDGYRTARGGVKPPPDLIEVQDQRSTKWLISQSSLTTCPP